MAEVTTTIEQIDLLNIEKLVKPDQIAELQRLRNCLVHAMDPHDIVRVVWELVSQLPMMQMHRMYSTEEIFKTSWVHLQELGEEGLKPLDDGKQKIILCAVRLPLKRKYPGKRLFQHNDDKHMEPMYHRDQVTDRGVLEQLILVDREARFHVLEAYWETLDELSSRPSYQRSRQLKEVSLKEVEGAHDLYSTMGGGAYMVSFFHHAMSFLEEVLKATLHSVRHDFEKSVSVENKSEGDRVKYEKYLTLIRSNDLFIRVRNQVHYRYGTK